MMYPLIVCWLLLMILTQAGIDIIQRYPAAWILILTMAAFKGWLIIDCFMELHRAPRRWRYLLLSWPTIMAFGIGAFIGW